MIYFLGDPIPYRPNTFRSSHTPKFLTYQERQALKFQIPGTMCYEIPNVKITHKKIAKKLFCGIFTIWHFYHCHFSKWHFYQWHFTIWHFYHRHFFLMAFLLVFLPSDIFTYGNLTYDIFTNCIVTAHPVYTFMTSSRQGWPQLSGGGCKWGEVCK